MRKPTTLLLVLAVGLSCSKDSGTGPTFPASISVIPDSTTVNLFDHVQLRAVVINNKGDTLNEAVSWSASPPTVAFVSPTGLTQGLSRGTATIHAALNGVEGLARVKVKITVIQVQLQPTGGTLQVGDTLRIKDTLIMANGQRPDDSIVTWTSSDTTKAVVSATGLVTGRAQGSVTISAQVDSAISHATFTLPEPVTKVTMSAHVDTLRQDSAFSVTIVELGTANDTLSRLPTWTSSDTSVAKISTNVTQATIGGYKAGRAVIRAQVGSVFDSCVVVVVRPSVAVIQLAPALDTLLADSLVVYTSTVKDSVGVTLNGRTVTWASADTGIATVTPSGIATAHGAGTTYIRATADSRTDSAKIVSIRPTVTTLALRPDSGHFLARQSIQLTALMTDSVGDSLVRPVTWTSLAPGTASVTSTGLVTGIAAGAANIRAQIDARVDTAHLTVDTVFAHPVEIRSSASFACVRNADGHVACWGANQAGETGHLPEATPCDTLISCIGTPTAVSGGLAFTSIVTGGTHTCGLVSGGQAYCWGLANYGQVGNGPSVSCGAGQCTQGPIALNGGLTFLSLSAGQDFTCGIATDSTAWCWGFNGDYQLGGDSVNAGAHNAPIPVYGNHKFARIALGALHACGITGDGTAYCWGKNGEGEVGIDSMNPGGADYQIRVPTPVLGNHTFTDIVSGWYHTCGLVADGTTYCWGSNGYGMLGNGTTDVAWMPTVIPNGWRFSSLTAGMWNTCGTTTGGTSECWGLNTAGQLGIGTTGGQSVSPVPPNGGPYSILSPGEYFICGIQSGGTLYCWGDNYIGELGIGPETAPVPTPIPVIGQP